MNRRRFLAAGAVAAGGSALLGAKRRRALLPTDTPEEVRFRIMWYNPSLPIDEDSYRLGMGGMVDSPQRFSLDRLQTYPRVERSSRLKFVQCWSSRTTWAGFRFEELVEVVKPLAGATAVRIDCADKWYEYMSLEETAAPGVMMCLEMAGKPLTDPHGAPLRLLAPVK